ncbi:MAG: HAD-IC family P-type ATPase, partial [Acutalibacteraceae bacterium]
RRGGISTVMITGDPLTSARKAAEELGILYGDKVALNGEHLAALSDDELCEIVERIAVYSRISPEDKLRIVRAWQKKGHIVAVTGDFHGDAEALKAADVGYAMGKKGSDIARESADITLADDSFTTIASSVAYGRNAFNNIRRVMQYLIGTNLGELFTIIFGLIIFKRSPLSVLPLLWMNIITDSLPAICLGLEPPAYDILARPPVKTYDTVFGKKFMLLTSFTGILVAALSLTAYSIGSRTSAEAGRAMVFGVITFAELAVCLCMRSRHSLFDRKMPKNNLLILTVVSSVLLTAAILLITPVGIAFGTASMSFIQWAWVMGLSLIPIVFFEIGKFFLSFKKAR